MSDKLFRSILPGHMLRFTLWLLVTGVSGLVLLSVYLSSLSANGRWVSSKTSLEKGVMGAWSFMLSRTSLAGNKLDLGAWHGYQEVFLKNQPLADEVRFRFRLDPDAALVVYLSAQNDTLTAIRLSSDSNHPSAVLKIVNQVFDGREPLGLSIEPGVWYQFNGLLSDGVLRATVSAPKEVGESRAELLTGMNVLGFRAYEGSTLVDDIVLKHGNEVVFRESFGVRLSKWPWILVCMGLGVLLYWLMPDLQRFFRIAIINLALIMILLTAFYLIRGQYLYPKEWMMHWNSKTTTIATEAEVAARAGALMDQASPSRKVMFLGSSQTWGAGASVEANTFVSRFEKLVNLDGTSGITAINTGISGVNSNQILKNYRDQWVNSKPDLTVINLSLNDAGNPQFRSNIQEIILLNNSRGIQTVLICEPLAVYQGEHHANQKIMKELAEAHGLPLIEPQPVLHELSDAGFLYWDFVHLTNAGHQLMAQMLAVELIPLLVKLNDSTSKDQ